jgi:hypothetical protein
LFFVLLGGQLEVQNIGATTDKSSYAVGVKESLEDNDITKKIFQQEIMNIRNIEQSRSREGSAGLESSGNSTNLNRNRLSFESGKQGIPESASSGITQLNQKVISQSSSSAYVSSSLNGPTSSEKSPQSQSNVNINSPTSLQNILNKFNVMSPSNKTEKVTTPTGKEKSFMERISEFKNTLTNNNNNKVTWFFRVNYVSYVATTEVFAFIALYDSGSC